MILVALLIVNIILPPFETRPQVQCIFELRDQ